MGRSSERLSLKTSDAVKGGGIDGAEAVIKEIEFVEEFDFNGKADTPSAALRVQFEVDGMEKPWTEHYTIGKSKFYEVIDNGNAIKPLGKAEGINEGSTLYRFLSAAEKADGYSGYHDEGSVEDYDGLRVRLGRITYEGRNGDPKELTVIAAFLGNGNGKAAGKGSGKSSKGPSVEDKTNEAIKLLLEDTPKIKRKDLGKALYDANKQDADVKAMMQLTYKDQWVGGDDRSFTWDRKKDVIVAKDED